MSAVLEQAHFNSVPAALLFAFRQHHENYQASLMNRMPYPPGSQGRGLGGLDGAAMAGSIKRHVLTLGSDVDAVLRARFVTREQTCSNPRCCNGREETKEFEAAVLDVMYCTDGLISGISNYRFRHGVIRRHFGSKVHLGDLRLKCGLAERTAGDHIQRIKSFLQKKEGAAMHAISINLREAGIVNDELNG